MGPEICSPGTRQAWKRKGGQDGELQRGEAAPADWQERDRGVGENHTLPGRNPKGGGESAPGGLGGAGPTRTWEGRKQHRATHGREERGRLGLSILRTYETGEGSSARTARVDAGALRRGQRKKLKPELESTRYSAQRPGTGKDRRYQLPLLFSLDSGPTAATAGRYLPMCLLQSGGGGSRGDYARHVISASRTKEGPPHVARAQLFCPPTERVPSSS